MPTPKEDNTMSRADFAKMNLKERAAWVGVLPRYMRGSIFTPRELRKGRGNR